MSVRVACVGGAVLDLAYGVEVLPGTDGKTRALSFLEGGGGMAANAAVIVHRLGGEASWWGRVGDDDKGARILEGLRREGVDCDAARIVPGVTSPHSIVLADRAGNRAIVLYSPPSFDADPSFLPLSSLDRFDAVVADNRWLEATVATLARARALGLPAVLDAEVGTGISTRAAVAAATHAVFSEPGLCEIYPADDLAQSLRLAAKDCAFVAVTRGSLGVRWIDTSGRLYSLPAFAVDAVETSGAGDVFHGAFALALAEGRGEPDALRFASAAAALKCGAAGGRRSFPGRAEVEALMRANETREEANAG